MRITPQQRQQIKRIVAETCGEQASAMIFGSRADDSARGGDLDILVEVSEAVENPAWLIAMTAARVSRLMDGRRVDVLLCAPNLACQAIHQQAKATGIPL